jgi:hypothetical protein
MATLDRDLSPGDNCADCGAAYSQQDWRRWRHDDTGNPYCGICSRSRGLRD